LKKLLVLALALVLTLGIAAMASAATFSPYVGGEYEFSYSNANDDAPVSSFEGDAFGARYKAYVTGTAEDKDTGTWAKIGSRATTWGAANASIFEAGIKNVGGSKLNIWYTNDENDNVKRGQNQLLEGGWYKFVGSGAGDPLMDQGPGNVLGIDYNGDNVVINFLYGFNKQTYSGYDAFTGTANAVSGVEGNVAGLAGTFKFDGGDVHFSYYVDGGKETTGVYNEFDSTITDPAKQVQTIHGVTRAEVGAQFKVGSGNIQADYINFSYDDDTDSNGYFQADATFGKLDVVLLYDNKTYFPTDGGFGVGVSYNFTDKLYVGVKDALPNKEKDNTATGFLNGSNVYVGYIYGIFNTRVGVYTPNDDTQDPITYLATWVGMW
jgi:hypothetical protein